MEKLSFYSHSSQETIYFAKKLSKFLRKGNVVGLFGNLGSGKTTFIKGLAQGLGLKNRVNSPSFVILKIYRHKDHQSKIPLYHLDLYRLKTLKELEDIGFEDFIYNSGICVIEWADKAKKLLPNDYLKIKIYIKGQNCRLLQLIGLGRGYKNLIKQIRTYHLCFRQKDRRIR